VTVDDSLSDRESHSRALVFFGAMKSLKNTKEFAGVLHIESHAIVLDVLNEWTAVALGTNLNARSFLLAGVFHGIGK
jgi:hypothetical protein